MRGRDAYFSFIWLYQMNDLKKRVLILSYEYPPIGGGAGVVAKELFSALYKGNNKVDLLIEGDVDSVVEYDSGCYCFPITKGWVDRKFWSNIFHLKQMVKNYDVIILNDFYSKYLASYFFNKKERKKTILVMHGSEPEVIYESPSVKYKILFFRYFFERLLNDSKRIVTVSEYMKDKFLNLSSYHSIGDKIKTIYSWVSRGVYFEDEEGARRELRDRYLNSHSKSIDSSIILTVSRIVEGKGFDDLLCSIEGLLRNHNWIWIVVGAGEYEKEFRKKISQFGLEDRVLFEGRVESDKLREYYWIADVFCLLSKLRESFGLCYLEAMSCGTVPIGYNKAGVKEIIDNHVNGFLLDNGYELSEILISGRYKNINKCYMREKANFFSEKNSIEEYEKLINE